MEFEIDEQKNLAIFSSTSQVTRIVQQNLVILPENAIASTLVVYIKDENGIPEILPYRFTESNSSCSKPVVYIMSDIFPAFVTYFISDLYWYAGYNLIVSESGVESLIMLAYLVNQTENDIRNSNVSLVLGNVSQPHPRIESLESSRGLEVASMSRATQSMRPLAGASEQAMELSPSSSSFRSNEDFNEYERLSININSFPRGSTRFVARKIHDFKHNEKLYYCDLLSNNDVKVGYTFNTYSYLPSGETSVFDMEVKLLGFGKIKSTVPGEEVNLMLGTSSKVSCTNDSYTEVQKHIEFEEPMESPEGKDDGEYVLVTIRVETIIHIQSVIVNGTPKDVHVSLQYPIYEKEVYTEPEYSRRKNNILDFFKVVPTGRSDTSTKIVIITREQVTKRKRNNFPWMEAQQSDRSTRSKMEQQSIMRYR